MTVLSLKFRSPSILTKKEEEAYPIVSLVADCGGVLGLFLGFNFLMIWDSLFHMFKKFKFSQDKRV